MNQILKPPSTLTVREPAPVWFQTPVYQLTVEHYHRMNETGILPSGTRVELLQGYLVVKMPQNPPHAGAVGRLNRRIMPLVPADFVVRVQAPITLKDSEPEPDLWIAYGPEEKYNERHPGPRDTVLVIEVAESSLLADQRGKGMLYAQAKVPIYWIVNLVDGTIEVYSSPRAGKHAAYQQRQDYGKDALIPMHFAGQDFGQLAVKELLP